MLMGHHDVELQAWFFNVYSVYRSWESRSGFADWSENWVWAVVGAAVVVVVVGATVVVVDVLVVVVLVVVVVVVVGVGTITPLRTFIVATLEAIAEPLLYTARILNE